MSTGYNFKGSPQKMRLMATLYNKYGLNPHIYQGFDINKTPELDDAISLGRHSIGKKSLLIK